MGKKDEAQRQELVTAIEGGRYKSGQNTGKIVLITLIVTFTFIFLVTSGVSLAAGNKSQFGALALLFFFMYMPVVLLAVALSLNKGADLGKLSSLQRWLILNGDKIEADLDAIDQKGSLYIISCIAECGGQKYRFVSPSISVRPIPFEERKISVYVNPQNPHQYLIDIYSHLPLAGDTVLHDRSEMKVDTSKKNPNQSTTTLLLVMCLVFFVPFALLGFFAGIGGILSGDTAFGVVTMIMCPTITALAIWGICAMAKKNKSVASNGYYIPATAQRFWVTKSKNGTYYHLSARYIEPSTKQVHEFQTTGPRAMKELVGTKVNTFINPDNTREYFMDTQTALKKLGFTTSREKGE